MLLSLDVQRTYQTMICIDNPVLFRSPFQSDQECVEDKRTFLRNDGYVESIPVSFYKCLVKLCFFLAASYLPKFMQTDTFYMSGKRNQKKEKKKRKKMLELFLTSLCSLLDEQPVFFL